jgi:anti-anti-sigma factor
MPQTCESQEQLRIEFEGSLDTAKCMQIEAEVRGAVDGSTVPVVFDLAKVDFISSAFLRLCIHAQHQAKEHGFRIAGAGPSVKRVLKIAGLDAMLGEG